MNHMYLEKVPSNKVLRLTKSGLDGLKQRLDMLTAERHQIYNYVHTTAKEPQNMNDLLTQEKIKDLERDDKELYKILQVLQYATVISKVVSPDSIDIGLTAVLKNDRDEEREFTVVCPLEVDPENHKISDESPLGKLLIGKKVGDTFQITNPKGMKVTYTIMEIVQ